MLLDLAKADAATHAAHAAHAALMALPSGVRGRLAAHVLQGLHEEQADRAYGPRKGPRWIGWLRWRRRDYRRLDDIIEPVGGWCDHPETREDGDGRRTFIAHPYLLRLDALRALIDFCEQHDLDCFVKGQSWYFPGNTVAVILEAREQQAAPRAHPLVVAR